MAQTLVLGASPLPHRYSYLAVLRLRKAGHPVIAVGRRSGQIADVPILLTLPAHFPAIDTVTLYLNAAHQKHYEGAILGLKPRRVIFNPGTENEPFAADLLAAGIGVVEACTLVLLSTGRF